MAWLEVLPGLRVDVERLADSLGDDPGEPFLLAGLAMLEAAIVEARADQWWHSLPRRGQRRLEDACARALRLVELAATMQAAHVEELHRLTRGSDLAGELHARARTTGRTPE